GLAGLVFLVGLGLTFQPASKQAAYVIVVLLAATVPLLLTALLDEAALAFDFVFFAGCALAVYYPLAALVLAIARRIKARLSAMSCQPAISAVASLLLVAAFAVLPSFAAAQLPPVPEDLTPVAVPVDAIIVPYDPEKLLDRGATEKILVPYPKYVE